RPRPLGVPYLTELAVDALKGFSSLVLVDARPPVGFFAYPGQPSVLADPSSALVTLAAPGEDALGALTELADLVGTRASVGGEPLERVGLPVDGALNVDNLSAVVGALLPDDAVVVDEAVTASVLFVERTAGAGEHDYLFLTGGSIGWGMPCATGAAVGAPG